jgi:predicted transcriptional regulator
MERGQRCCIIPCSRLTLSSSILRCLLSHHGSACSRSRHIPNQWRTIRRHLRRLVRMELDRRHTIRYLAVCFCASRRILYDGNVVIKEEITMIRDILRLINNIGIVNTSEIAEKIGATPSMVQQSIAMLQSKGYLSLINLNQSCGENQCASCGHCKATTQTSKCAYVITEKGKKYLNSK